jgi:hypothetical protein
MQDPHFGAHPYLVEPLQATADDLRRGAVAERSCDTKAEAGATAEPRRVHRRQQQRGAFEVVARAEADLGEDVGPVRRQRRDLRIPLNGERHARQWLRLHRGGVTGGQLQLAVNPRLVEAPECARDNVWRMTAAAARGREADGVAASSGVEDAE